MGARLAWRGRKVLITSGPTREYLDPIRYLTNSSSGRMGFSIAREARARGAKVVVVSGPVSLAPPKGVRVRRVLTAEQMRAAAMSESRTADVIIAAAAVSDWRFERTAGRKLKRGPRPMTVKLVPNPDIIAEVGRRASARRGRRPLLVGFALETHRWLEHARDKLRRKGLDYIVANRLPSLGSESTRLAVLGPAGLRRFPPMPKPRAAASILDCVEAGLGR